MRWKIPLLLLYAGAFALVLLGSLEPAPPAFTARAESLHAKPFVMPTVQPVVIETVEHITPQEPIQTPVQAPQATPKPSTPQRGSLPSGSCASWIAAAGIDNPSAASFIFQKESGCRPQAVNGSGCAGLGQACPGSKLPCSLNDGVCQAKYFDGYAKSRYGSWSAALAFWQSHRWW